MDIPIDGGGAVAPPRRASIIAIAVGLTIAGALPVLMLGAVGASIIADTQVSTSQFGTAFAALSATSMAFAVVLGNLAERLGWRRSAAIACALSATSLAGLGLFATGTVTLAAFAAVGGLAQATGVPTANLLIAREVGGQGSGAAVGLKQSAVPVAAVIAGALVPLVVLDYGWRTAFIGVGVAVLLLPMAFWRVRSGPARHDPRPSAPPAPRAAASGTGPPGRPGGPGRNERSGAPADAALAGRRLPPTLTRPGGLLFLMALTGFFATAAAHSYNAFFVISSVETGLPEGRAATVFAASGFVCVLARILCGVSADRSRTVSAHPLRASSVVLLSAVVGLAMIAAGAPGMLIVGALLAYGIGFSWPTLYHFAIVRYFKDFPARATGILRVGLAGGSMLGPFVFGFVAESISFRAAWAGATVAAAIAGLMLLKAERSPR